MKKIILAIALFAVTGAAMAQNDVREKARAERQNVAMEKLQGALATQNFTFTPFSYTPSYQAPVQLNYGPQSYVEVFPESLSVMVPFTVGVPSPVPVIRMLNLPSVNYTYAVKNTDQGHYIVTIGLNNVSSVSFGPSMKLQNINLTLHFDISSVTGQTTLTISPDFSPSTSYTGVVRGND